jgi:hypothetical protein
MSQSSGCGDASVRVITVCLSLRKDFHLFSKEKEYAKSHTDTGVKAAAGCAEFYCSLGSKTSSDVTRRSFC